MSIKLNKSHRTRIRYELMKGKFTERTEAVTELENKLAYDVYKQSLGANYKKFMDCPRGWFEKRSDFRVRFGGMDTRIEFGEEKNGDTIYEPLPDSMCGWGIAIGVYDAEHKFTKRWVKIDAEKQAIDKEMRTMENEIDAVTESVTTVNKLRDTWPEIADVVNTVVGENKTTLPAVNLKGLNKQLGLVA